MPKRSRSENAVIGRRYKRRNLFGVARRASFPRRTLTAKVNQLLNSQELKVFDVSNAALAIPATGVVVALNSMAAGDDVTQRNGRRIALVSSSLRFHFMIGDGIASAPSTGRVVIVYDAQCNGATPTWTDVFTSADSTTERNIVNRERFTIIYDNYMSSKKGYLSVGGLNSGGTGYESGIYDQVYRKLSPMVSEYVSTGAAVPQTGGLFLLALCDNPGVMRYTHRVSFNDS